MKTWTFVSVCLTACLTTLVAGCAPTKVYTMDEFTGTLPRPERILVYDFAVAPDEVQLDKGIGAEIQQAMNGTPRTEEERKIGHVVADALARHLVTVIAELGIPVARASGTPPTTGNILTIQGQFVSIDQGNRTERVIIGLGMGRSDVKANIQAYDMQGGGRILACSFQTDAKSGYKPGAAETMGAGAAAGNLAASAAVTAGSTTASELLSANVEADAERTAKNIAPKLKQYFVMQGWIQSSN